MTKIDRVITGLLYCTKEESYTDFNYCDKCPYYDDHCRHDEMLVDAAELLKRLVLCKDCKHSKSYGNGMLYGCAFGNGLHKGNWFCADGERKDDGG